MSAGTAGEGGALAIRWYDSVKYRMAVSEVGENGINPNVKYKIENGKFVEVK